MKCLNASFTNATFSFDRMKVLHMAVGPGAQRCCMEKAWLELMGGGALESDTGATTAAGYERRANGGISRCHGESFCLWKHAGCGQEQRRKLEHFQEELARCLDPDEATVFDQLLALIGLVPSASCPGEAKILRGRLAHANAKSLVTKCQ